MTGQNTGATKTNVSTNARQMAPSSTMLDILAHHYTLSEAALRKQNTDTRSVNRLWDMEEMNRIERLQRAAMELGFELPSRCYHR
jgi:hypothetical protein